MFAGGQAGHPVQWPPTDLLYVGGSPGTYPGPLGSAGPAEKPLGTAAMPVAQSGSPTFPFLMRNTSVWPLQPTLTLIYGNRAKLHYGNHKTGTRAGALLGMHG